MRKNNEKRLMSHCPFCHAPASTVGYEGDRKYECGSWGDRTLGLYKKMCGQKATIQHVE